MRVVAAHIAVVAFIIYASLFGGVVETHPIVKIVHQVGSALIVAGWLVSLRLRKRSFPVTRMDWPLWALGVGWLVSAAFGEDPRVSFEFVWITFVHIILFFIAMDVIRSGHQRWLFEGLFFTGGVIVILGVIEMLAWYFGIPLVGSGQSWPEIGGYTIPPVIHELSLPLNHNNPTGAYTVILIPLVLAWSNTTRESDLKWGLRALAIGLFIVLVLTQSRGAYLALVALVGFATLIWLLRPDVRTRFPRWIQPVIAPRFVLIAAALGGIVAAMILYQIIVVPNHPNPNDVTRISLWYSAVRMFQDYPLLGIGPAQFKALQLCYGNWEYTYSYLSLNHAHNLFFNVLAEGGTILLMLATWVIVRFARIWWATWRNASPHVRRRLEGVLVALLAFAAHNTVDTFLQTQFVVPVAIMAAYTASHDPIMLAAASVRGTSRISRARLSFTFAACALMVGQIAFIPIIRGALQQQRYDTLYGDRRYDEALEAIRDAQNADPWLELYALEEAVLLGMLANDAPDTYLADATHAFENALELNSAWDIGWHNLAALYAQARDYTAAIAAEETAYGLNPLVRDYLFKQGEYHELAGNWETARAIYLRVLRSAPWFAASDYWANPARAIFLADALDYYKDSAISIDLMVYSGDFERLAALATTPASAPPGTEQRLALLWPEGSDEPCIYCYHARENAVLREAEIRLHTEALTPELLDTLKASVGEIVFIGEPGSAWGHYILARLADDERMIDDYLAYAVVLPVDFRGHFPKIYQMQGKLDVIPQARAPVISAIAYEPWLVLAEREAARGNFDEAQRVIDAIMKIDPYARVDVEGLRAAAQQD